MNLLHSQSGIGNEVIYDCHSSVFGKSSDLSEANPDVTYAFLIMRLEMANLKSNYN